MLVAARRSGSSLTRREPEDGGDAQLHKKLHKRILRVLCDSVPFSLQRESLSGSLRALRALLSLSRCPPHADSEEWCCFAVSALALCLGSVSMHPMARRISFKLERRMAARQNMTLSSVLWQHQVTDLLVLPMISDPPPQKARARDVVPES